MSSTISPRHAAARTWAKAGVPVFPCRPDTKQPAVTDWPNAATTDMEVIDAWWSKADYNLALVLDRAGLAAIDLDGLEGVADWNDLAHEHLWSMATDTTKPTYCVKTPSGGYHLYFDGTFRTTQHALAPHVDTRGPGSYVLAPPSHVMTEAGERCTGDYVLVDGRDPVKVPEWLAQVLEPRQAQALAPPGSGSLIDSPASIARAKAHMARVDPPDPGDRNNSVFRIACTLGDLGVSEEAATELMEDWYGQALADNFTEEEAHAAIASAFEHRTNELAAHAVQPASVALAEAARAWSGDGGNNRAKTAVLSRFHAENWDEQDSGAEPAWLLSGLIPERSSILVIAPPKGGKSWFLLDVALSIAAGVPWAGIAPARSAKVLYVAGEKRVDLKRRRARAWALGHQIDRVDNFYVMPPPLLSMPGEAEEWFAEVARVCDGEPPALIIFDTAARVMVGMEENSAKDVGLFARFVQATIERFKCAVAVAHHQGKDAAKGARGSSAFLGNFDTIIETEYTRMTKALVVRVREHSDYDVEDGKNRWTFEGRKIGTSLYFSQTRPEEHAVLVNEGNPFAPHKIAEALRYAEAIGVEHAVTSNVLAKVVVGGIAEGQTDEDYGAQVSRVERTLRGLAHGKLQGYATGTGSALRWFLEASVIG